MKLTVEQVEELINGTSMTCVHKNDVFESFSWSGILDGYGYNFVSTDLHCDSPSEELRAALEAYLLDCDYIGMVDTYTTKVIEL